MPTVWVSPGHSLTLKIKNNNCKLQIYCYYSYWKLQYLICFYFMDEMLKGNLKFNTKSDGFYYYCHTSNIV